MSVAAADSDRGGGRNRAISDRRRAASKNKSIAKKTGTRRRLGSQEEAVRPSGSSSRGELPAGSAAAVGPCPRKRPDARLNTPLPHRRTRGRPAWSVGCTARSGVRRWYPAEVRAHVRSTAGRGVRGRSERYTSSELLEMVMSQ